MNVSRMCQLVGLSLVLVSLPGCNRYAEWQQRSADADLRREKAEILKMYRMCLQENPGTSGRTQCEHYTQTLHSVDIGLR